MDNFIKKGKYASRSWMEIALDFFDTLKNRLNYAVYEQQKNILRKFIAAMLILIGSIFFLNGLAVFLGELMNESSWSGYLMIGILLMLVGVIVPRK